MTERYKNPRVLVADDDRTIADTLALILNQSGFDTRAVYSGEKALQLAPAFRPDLLISDVLLDDLNGVDLAITVRELLPAIKVFLLSGRAPATDLLEKAHAQGHEFEVLVKPIHPQDLLKRLRATA